MLTLPDAVPSVLIPFATLFRGPAWRKAQVLPGLLIRHLDWGDGPLVFGTGETLERRQGPQISVLGVCRDAVRSSSYVVKAQGLRWISLMWLGHMPWDDNAAQRTEGPPQHCGDDPDALVHPRLLEVMDSGFHGNPRPELWMSGSAREMSTDLLQRLGMMGQGNLQDESGIGQQAVAVKGNGDAVGAAQVIASIGRSGCGVGFVFPNPLSPKPGTPYYSFNPPTHSSLRGIGGESSTVPLGCGQTRCRRQSSRQE